MLKKNDFSDISPTVIGIYYNVVTCTFFQLDIYTYPEPEGSIIKKIATVHSSLEADATIEALKKKISFFQEKYPFEKVFKELPLINPGSSSLVFYTEPPPFIPGS